MITVHLHGAEFFAYHGFYAEEQLLGCKYLIDLSVEIPAVTDSDDLNDTVNYEQLYAICKREMDISRKLIETVAFSIQKGIVVTFPFIESMVLSVTKVNPPMLGSIKGSGVTIKYNKADGIS